MTSVETPVLDAQTLRAELMAPQPMRRAMALHALEVELDHADAKRALSHQVASFVARGIPFYAPDDAHYREWVGKVVGYWQRLSGGEPASAGH